jgi:hypothetical protein
MRGLSRMAACEKIPLTLNITETEYRREAGVFHRVFLKIIDESDILKRPSIKWSWQNEERD